MAERAWRTQVEALGRSSVEVETAIRHGADDR